jgi:hypothetical protein
MIFRATWLRRRLWNSAAGISTRGWFWEASYYEFYSSSFSGRCPHWLPIQLCVPRMPWMSPLFAHLSGRILRICLLMLSLISQDYWKLFAFYMAILFFFIAELIFKPWSLRAVQLYSNVSYFLLMFAIFVLARPASTHLFQPLTAAAASTLHFSF